ASAPASPASASPAPGAPVKSVPAAASENLLPAPIAIPRPRIGPVPLKSNTKSFLWEVKTLTNKVWLFGTMHVGKRMFYPLPEVVESAFDDSARLVVEADVSKPGGGDTQALISYAPPDSLDKHVPKPLFERLHAQLTRLKIPTEAVKPMKPFVVGGFLSLVEFSRLGYDMNLGVDAYLFSRAREAGKPIEELESSRAQLEMLANMSPALQEAFLDNAVASLELDRSADQVTGMVNAWQTGDTKLMAEVNAEVNRGMRMSAELDEIMLYSRHDAMLKKIEGYLAGGEKHFVAVGSLHLVGPRGLIQVLKSKGYEVTQK
ncbi:MAG: TraB/GumN family protein, partial [Betaproteobacteria bacterium]